MLFALVLAGLASAPALAHGGRVHFGFYVGAPLYYHSWYAPPPFWYWPPPAYYYPPAVVTVPAQPTTYVERDPAPQVYWYYCRDARAYYPYVKECPGGWEKVLPRPQ